MKSKKMFLLAAVLVLSMFVAGGLWAQGVPGGFVSPTAASSRLFRSAADDFIRPDTYKSANVENWFLMSAFSNAGNTAPVNIGYANNFGNLYLAAYYGGTFWRNVPTLEYDTDDLTMWHGKDKGNGKIKKYDNTNWPFNLTAAPAPDNRFSVLIGAGDMGFRFSLYTDLNRFSGKDFIAGGNEYESYKYAVGTMSPQLAWAMSKNMSDNGIRPWVTLDLPFNRNYRRYTMYDPTNNYKAGDEVVASSANSVNPQLNFGLGGYTFARKDNFSAAFDADYMLSFYIYKNDYNYMDSSGKLKIDSYKGVNTGAAFAEPSNMTNQLRPYVTGIWNWEKVGFRTRLYLPMRLNVNKTVPVDWKDNDPTKHTLVQDGSETKTATFTFNPSIDLGVQWKVGSKFTLLAGGRIMISTLGLRTVTEGEEYANGKKMSEADLGYKNVTYKTTSTIRGTNPTGTDTSNTLTLGAALNATENLTFEAAMGVVAPGTNNSISVFETSANGLFHFANILLWLRY